VSMKATPTRSLLSLKCHMKILRVCIVGVEGVCVLCVYVRVEGVCVLCVYVRVGRTGGHKVPQP